MRTLAACALAALCGCGPDNGTAVMLTLDGTMLSAADRAAIAGIDFDVSGAERYQRQISLGRPFAASGRERILYQSKTRGGALSFAVAVRDAAGGERGGGAAVVELAAGKTVAATIPLGAALHDGGGSDSGGGSSSDGASSDGSGGDGGVSGGDLGEGGSGLLVTPATVSVPATRGQRFAASEPVTWSILEPNGGDIDAQGQYFAPVAPGSYHVVATSAADPGRTATVSVTATPLALRVVAGTTGGAGNLDGLGTEARFNGPTGLCSGVLGTQDAFVADTGNHTLRRIDLGDNNRVTTIVGDGTAGDVDGSGTAARLNLPQGIACTSDAIYIADSGNGKIKKVALFTGAVTTFSSGFTRPTDVALDALNSRLLVADEHVLYALSLPDGARSTLAGNGAAGQSDNSQGLMASFFDIKRLAVNGPTLLVADENQLRTVDLTPSGTAAVSTVPTTGLSATALGPRSLATSTQIFNITPPDMGATNFTAIAGSPTDGALDGAGAAARFEYINYLSPDLDTFFVSDRDIVRVLSAGATVTLAGKQGAIYGEDWQITGLTLDDAGQAYAIDSQYGLRRIDLASGAASLIPLPDPPVSPAPSPGPKSLYLTGVWIDHALYLGDVRHQTINRYDPTKGEMTIVAGEYGVSGASDGTGAAAHFNYPGYLTGDGSGRIYLSDVANNAIRTLDVATGAVETLAGSGMAGASDGVGRAASFSSPDHLALDGKGGLYVADRGNKVIRKIDLANGLVTRFAGGLGQAGIADGTADQARFEEPWGLACDGHSLFVTSIAPPLAQSDTPDPAIRQIDLVTGMVAHFVGTTGKQGIRPGPLPATLSTVNRSYLPLAVTPAGDLLIADAGSLLVVQPQ